MQIWSSYLESLFSYFWLHIIFHFDLLMLKVTFREFHNQIFCNEHPSMYLLLYKPNNLDSGLPPYPEFTNWMLTLQNKTEVWDNPEKKTKAMDVHYF